MRVILLQNMTHNGHRHKAGEIIDFDDNLVDALQFAGLVEIAPESPERPVKREARPKNQAVQKTAPKKGRKAGKK